METFEFNAASTIVMSEISECIDKISVADIKNLVQLIQSCKNIFCFGVGRSGAILQSFCIRLNHLKLSSYYLNSIPCPPATKDDLLLLISGSGETGSVLSYANQAKQIGCNVACITANSSDNLTSLCKSLVLVEAPSSLVNPEKSSIQPMRSLFEQTAFIICETILLMLQNELRISELEMAQKHANIV